MSIFAELRRRNVIRMAGLYLVGAWLVVQIAETLLPIFRTPDWVLATFVVVLAIGFVPTLIFSWVYELTPEGLKRDAEVPLEQSIGTQTARRLDQLILLGLLLVVIVVAADRYWPRSAAPMQGELAGAAIPESADPAAPVPALAAPNVAPSIAVLPFVNMSEDANNAYFSDGISEELLNVLARVEGIGVASRTSSFGYKGRELGAMAIAKALKVNHILEGSVRKSGNRVRITAQLIDAVNDRHLWSETYDRELTDIFAIQDEIANAIVSALRTSLVGVSAAKLNVRADTDNMEAYDLYLKARELFIARSDLKESIRLFERVVEIDPTFARGWEGLAAVGSVARASGIADRDYNAIAKSAAERALALDPALSMPWAALSMVEKYQWPVDFERNLSLLDRAVAADPRNSTAIFWRGVVWTGLGFFDRAIAELDHCLTLEPGYHNCRRFKAMALLSRGDDDAAIALFDQGVADGFVSSRQAHFVAALLLRGDATAALLLMDSLKVPPPLRSILIEALRHPDAPHPSAKALIERYLPDPNDPLFLRAGAVWLYLWLGDFDNVANNDDATSASPAWERYPPGWRNSPGFKTILQRRGVVDYWRKHDFPPQCRALGATDFECDAVQP